VNIIGVFYSLLVAFVWGSAPIIYRYCIASSSALKMQAVRSIGFLGCGLVIAAFSPDIMRVAFHSAFLVSIGGLSALLVGDSLFFHGIKLIGPGTATAITGTYPFFASVAAILFLGEKATTATVVGTICIFVGLVVFRMKKEEPKQKSLKGVLLALLAAFFWSVNFVLTRWGMTAGNISPKALVFWQSISFFISIWLCWGISWFRNGRQEPFFKMPLKNMLMMITVGVLSMGLGGFLTSEAMRYAPASVVTPITASSPLFAAFWGRVLYREPILIPQWIGIVLILAGGVAINFG
jgi:drug/metabolite transporter (DMT)-like permease